MSEINRMLLEGFSCPKCQGREASVERLAMSGTGVSRILNFEPHEYAFVSCADCGYTEVYDLRILKNLRRR
jgi:predicted nucleic-acid-binding Zn-ribbon protein